MRYIIVKENEITESLIALGPIYHEPVEILMSDDDDGDQTPTGYYILYIINAYSDSLSGIDKYTLEELELAIAKIRSGTYVYKFGNYPRDQEGSPLVRVKSSELTGTYHGKFISFQTSTLGSVSNEDVDYQDIGDVTIKFYNNLNVELFSAANIASSCVKTVVDFQPDHDIELICSGLHIRQKPESDTNLWIEIAPDIPEKKITLMSNVNLSYLTSYELRADKKSSHRIHHAGDSSNILRTTITHAPGYQEDFGLFMEMYR